MFPNTFRASRPFRTDTCDRQFLHAQLASMVPLLGPRVMVALGNANASPEAQLLWRRDFIDFIDALRHKRLLLAHLQHQSRAPAGSPMPPVRLPCRA